MGDDPTQGRSVSGEKAITDSDSPQRFTYVRTRSP
jgi:hypothetical protein